MASQGGFFEDFDGILSDPPALLSGVAAELPAEAKTRGELFRIWEAPSYDHINKSFHIEKVTEVIQGAP